MDREIAARFDSVDARFEQLIGGMARQLELMEARAHERHERLLEYLHARFESIGRSFEEIDRRFEAVDRRFEAVDRRFEAVDRRFGQERARIAGRFEAQQKHMDRRFDLLGEALDARFTGHDRRLSALERKD